MKICIFLTIFSIISCQSNIFILDGTLNDKAPVKLFLGYFDYENNVPVIIDSTVSHHGSFKFKGKVDGMMEFGLLNSKSGIYSQPFFVQKGKNKINESNAEDDTGSFSLKNEVQSYKDQQSLIQRINEFSLKHEYIYEKYNALSQIQDSALLHSDDYKLSFSYFQHKVDSLSKQTLEIEEQFIATHPKSYFSAFHLYHPLGYGGTMLHKQDLYNSLDTNVKSSYFGKLLSENFKKYFKIAIDAPEIIGMDINNKNFRLSDKKGKYVLLEFWASWCEPCRESNKKLLEWHIQFSDKINLEIVYISVDDSRDSWIKAVAKDKIGAWNHFIKSDVSMGLESYYYPNIPTQILIGPNGKVISQYDSDPNYLRRLEKELLK